MPITGDATVITIRALSITDPVYQISGYIFDEATDPLAGTLVTLSGDASDSTTTFGDLGYSFTGLSNGNYTVTPTKSGYKFVQPSENVTIAYDNVIVDPMVGTQIWVISGYILDGDSAGIEGVTITLTGDASTETETDADGYYEFDEMYDGDYTITPTLAGYAFTADHEDVTVSGDDVVVDDMVGAGLGLPFCYNFSDFSVGDEVVLTGNESGWYSNPSVAPVYPSLSCETTVSDGVGSYGLTKCAQNQTNDAALTVSYFTLPTSIPSGMTSFRVSLMFKQSSRGTLEGGAHYLELHGHTGAEISGGATDDIKFRVATQSFNYDQLYYSNFANGSLPVTDVVSDGDGGSWAAVTQWCQLRAEVDLTAKTIDFAVTRFVDGEPSSFTTFSSLAALPASLFEVKSFAIISANTSRYNDYGGVWIGAVTDAWPSLAAWPASTF